MNWLMVVVGILFVFNVYSSHKKGFIKTVFETVSIIVAVLLTTILAPFIASQISSNKDIYDAISKQVKVIVKEDNTITSDEEQNKYIDDMPIPSKLKDYLRDNNTLAIYEERSLETFTDYVVDALTMIVINIISYIIMFVVIRIGLMVISGIVDLISKLPIIEEFDGMGGILIGAIKGIIEIWILLLVITLIANTELGMSAMKCINDSFILDMLYSNNILLQLIYTFLG